MSSIVVNSPAVVAEVFDEEVVVIHLDRGIYYSLTGSAPLIWPLIGCGLDSDAIAERVVSAFGSTGSDVDVAATVRSFLAELEAEALIRPGTGQGEPPELTEGVTFVPPRMDRFTDMQELIALDPVHDVTDTEGWPVKPPLTPKTG